jgi:hypothetical protein
MSGHDGLREALKEAIDWITKYEEALGHSYCDLNVGGGWAPEPPECTCGFGDMMDRWRAALAEPVQPETRHADHADVDETCAECWEDAYEGPEAGAAAIRSATPPASDLVGLDVERLARAIQVAIYDAPSDKGDLLGPLDNAEAIAAAYSADTQP